MRTRFFPKIRLESNDLEKEDDKIRVERRAEREEDFTNLLTFYLPRKENTSKHRRYEQRDLVEF